MQALFTKSYEFGTHEGLNLIEGEVISIASQNRSVKVPHIGWNSSEPQGNSDFTKGLKPESLYYFVHSYHLKCHKSE